MNSTFIIAEMSANHNQNLKVAIDTITAAKETGADAVKIQTYTPDTMTIDCNNDYFKISQGTIWDGTTLYKLYQQAQTPWEWHRELFDYAQRIGIMIFSTPFDITAVDFLSTLDNPIYKIASFEITDISLIENAAAKGKPMMISTGIANLNEIHDAVKACNRAGNDDITLLKCTSSYPAPLEEANLVTLLDMRERFGVKVGLSDHSLGSIAAVTAVALGATVIEKHFIVDRSIGGPDAPFSMEPSEFSSMVAQIRDVEKCMGTVSYDLSEKMKKNRKFARSIFAVQDINNGDLFSEQNVRSIRPGDGLSPKYLAVLLGKRAGRDIKKGTPIIESDLR